MRVCANMHDINTNNYVIHTHIYASCTSTYHNIRLITNIFKLKMAKFVITLRCMVESLSIREFVDYILAYSLFFHSEVGHVYSDTLSYIKRMYAHVRECTITYDNVQHITTRCSTMYNDVRQSTTMYDNVQQKMTSLRQYFCRTQKFYM